MKKITIIIGTARPESMTAQIGKLIINHVKNIPDYNLEIVDVADYPQTHTQGLDTGLLQDFHGKIDSAQGIIIVSPEYNHSFPGELKMLLDNLDEELDHKPVGICGVSSGPFGGARMIKSLQPIITQLGGVGMIHNVHVSMVNEILNKGQWKDVQVWSQRIDSLLQEMNSWIR